MQRQASGSTTGLSDTTPHRHWYPQALIVGMIFLLGMGVDSIQAQDRRGQRRTAKQPAVRQQSMTRLAQAGELRFDISPQSLSTALRQFSQLTNLDLSFDAALTQGLSSQGISGTYTPEHALQYLLVGTGLQYRFTSATTVTLERQVAQEQSPATSPGSEVPQLEPVTVTEERAAQGYRVERATTATKTDTPLRDIPGSIQVLPRQVIEDQGTVQVRDVLRNVSGVTAAESSFTVFSDAVNIRGFDARNNFVKNGLKRSVQGASIGQETANIERIEVLKGPSSVLYGQVEPGGIVNIVTKQPLTEPLYAGDFTAGSYNFFRPTVDLSGPINANKTILYRLNGAYETTEAFLDFFESQRFFVAPVVAFRLTPQTTLTLEGEYLQHNLSSYGGLPAAGTVLPNPNGQIPLHRWPGDPPFDNQERRAWEMSYRFEHRFNQHVMLRNAFRASFFRRDEDNVLPDFLDEDQRTLERFFFGSILDNNDYLLQTEVVVDFATGPVTHTALVGVEARWINEDRDSTSASFPALDLFNPTYFNRFSRPRSTPNRVSFDETRVGVYIQDQITLLKNLKLLVGGRFDHAEQDSIAERCPEERPNCTIEERRREGIKTSRDDTAFSPRVGLVYQPIVPLSLYASFSQSFQPQGGVTAEGTPFDPETGTQYEVGVKGEFLDGRMSATVAFFHITKQNVVSADPDDPEFERAIGEQTNLGVELDVAGEILPGWRVLASYAFVDAEVTKDFGGYKGTSPPNVAEQSFSLWSTYILQRGALQGLGVGAGLFYVGERHGDFENTFKVPDYLRADVALSYQPPSFSNVKARLTIQNLFDIEYYEAADSDVGVQPGAPLTVQGTVAVRF